MLVTEALPKVGAVVLGRAAECDIRIDDGSISRNHAVLQLAPELRIIDSSSVNGTWVRDERLAPNQSVEVRLDEAIRLGSVTIIVQRRSRQVGPTRRIRTHAYFENRVEDQCDLAQRRGSQFVVLHVVGEDSTVLRDTVLAAVGNDDIVAAYAPEELEVLLVATAPADGALLVQALERSLAQRGIAVRLGSAWYPRDGRTPDALAARARSRALGQVVVTASSEVVVVDERMTALHRLVARVALADISVLLLGETGVGKEVIAELIHRGSARASKPFLKLNCAALSETLLESELFGHEKGAFTGAIQTKPGLLEVAEGGVVFLDEVGELLPSTQAKLLRVLDERKLMRVGGLAPRAIDVRIVSATNRDLEAEVQRGAFRLDLMYRLNAMSISIPPLRERPNEILPLARKFLTTIATKQGRPELHLTDEAVALLRAHAWPGNVRELRNVIERAVVLATGDVVDVRDLPEDKLRATLRALTVEPARSSATAIEPALAADERQRILDALETCGNNQTHAAKLLGVSRRTLINKLEKFELPRPRKR